MSTNLHIALYFITLHTCLHQKSTIPARTESTTVTRRTLADQITAYEPGFMASRLQRMEKPQLNESEKDELLRKLQKLEKKQKSEILRLQKELDRVNKTWEMKVTILQQTLHALKDESFLRTTLQRQAARLQQAAVVYASDGPAVIVSNRRDFPGRTFRTLERPGGTKETVPFKKADRPAADSPFSEDRPTPAPPVEGEPPLTSNEETSMNANPGIGGIISREKNESPSSLLESSTSAKPVVDAV